MTTFSRDPRIDPKPGDVIVQRSGLRVRVTQVDRDKVEWSSGWRTNGWTMRGWRECVAKDSDVLKVSA